jgi:hypothetical protein
MSYDGLHVTNDDLINDDFEYAAYADTKSERLRLYQELTMEMMDDDNGRQARDNNVRRVSGDT